MPPGATPTRDHHFIPWSSQAPEVDPISIVSGKGVYFQDHTGHRYLDFLSQLFFLNLGHGNRHVIEAIQRQAETLCTASPALLHEGIGAVGQRLCAMTPPGLDKAFFTNSGSEANEIALTMARLVTGRTKIMAKYRSYHGTTLGTLASAGDPRRITVDSGHHPTVRFLDPYCYRCDFKLTYPACELHCAEAMERQIIMEGPETIAAIILEPFTGAAGGFATPTGYLKQIRQICDRYGILMIADEVICGFGRTGAMFAVDHDDVTPDILTLAKGLTSGYAPMGAAVVNRQIAEYFDTTPLPLGCTYTGHPLACAAALATFDEYERLATTERAHAMGEVLGAGLQALAKRHPCLGDVRCRGLLACLELVRDKATRQPLVPFHAADPIVDAIKARFLACGLYVYTRASLVLIAPPLITEEADLQEGLQRLDGVLEWVDEQI